MPRENNPKRFSGRSLPLIAVLLSSSVAAQSAPLPQRFSASSGILLQPRLVKILAPETHPGREIRDDSRLHHNFGEDMRGNLLRVPAAPGVDAWAAWRWSRGLDVRDARNRPVSPRRIEGGVRDGILSVMGSAAASHELPRAWFLTWFLGRAAESALRNRIRSSGYPRGLVAGISALGRAWNRWVGGALAMQAPAIPIASTAPSGPDLYRNILPGRCEVLRC
ncbi:MAG: hypothetical protein HY551_03320 [Elusimicrobia bacterium]|nr:hypothetical protein [Elusimicrobiota bacterium]